MDSLKFQDMPGYALPCRLDLNEFGLVLSLNKSIGSLIIELTSVRKNGFFAVHITLTEAIFQITLSYKEEA